MLSTIHNPQSTKNTVKTFAQFSSACFISTLLLGQTVVAAPFSYEYSDTLDTDSSIVLIAGVSVGDPVKIIVTLDNGGTTRNSQTWTSAHLQAVTFCFNNDAVITTFFAPFDDGLEATTGIFESGDTGALTSVMTEWSDSHIGADFTTTSVGKPDDWYLNGFNRVYGETAPLAANLTNVGNMKTATNWAVSTASCGGVTQSPVPAPILDFNQPAIIYGKEIILTE